MVNENRNSIIPTNLFEGKEGLKLDLGAMAYYVASGFFLENDTFWKDSKWSFLDFDNQPWVHEPRDLSLSQAVDEFATLFHQIVLEQCAGKRPILPLSGGLDSRTLAVAMHHLNITPHTYSYRFEGSFEETKYGKEIARKMQWNFDELVIPAGYLWQSIEAAGKINGCYAEFTHARQLAVVEEISKKGDLWLLGHWGDVLFDDMGVESSMPFTTQVDDVYKKVLKKGGKELAHDLWQCWNLAGNFEEHLRDRIERMHNSIHITNANSRIRAFKSLFWATRWTSTNLNFFSNYKDVALPYYDDRMCRFVMGIPEKHLSGRQIQIEYIKKYSPKLASISWQAKAPYNLFNYSKHQTLSHLPFRIVNRAKREVQNRIFGKKIIQRNWEIQFLGKENDDHLRRWLFENDSFTRLVPVEISKKYYNLFQTGDKVYWSHAVSMLLTLSVFSKQYEFKK